MEDSVEVTVVVRREGLVLAGLGLADCGVLRRPFDAARSLTGLTQLEGEPKG